MKIKKEYVNSLFFIGYVLILVGSFMTNILFVSNYCNLIKKIGTLLLLIYLIFQAKEYSSSKIIKTFVILLFCLIAYIISDTYEIITLFLLIFGLSSFSKNTIIEFDIKTKIVILSIVLVAYLFGLSQPVDLLREDSIRYSFGFSHPNLLGFILTSIVIEYLYLNKKRININHLIISITIILFNIFITNSRSSVMLLILITIFMFAKKDWLTKFFENKYVKFIVMNSWMILTILFIVLAFMYSKESRIATFINKLLSGRIYYINYFMNRYGLNVFGGRIVTVSNVDSKILNTYARPLDNAYILYLMRYGMILFVIFSYYFKKMFVKKYKEKDYIFIGILFAYMLYFSMENIVRQSLFVLFLYEAIYDDDMLPFSKKIIDKGEALWKKVVTMV